MGFMSKKKAYEVGGAVASEAAMIGMSKAGEALEAATGFPVTVLLEAGLSVYELREAAKNHKLIPNPRLLMNGHTSGDSEHTRYYLKMRRMKKFRNSFGDALGIGLQVAQDAATFGVGGVNVVGLVKHSMCHASALAHLARLELLARKVDQSEYLTALIRDMMKVIAAKASLHAGKQAAALIPNSLASNLVSAAVSLGAAGTAALMRELINRIAVEVHFRAYVELTIGKIYGNAYGPAARMAQELMNPTWAIDLTPKQKVRGYMLERAGYLVLKDKMAIG